MIPCVDPPANAFIFGNVFGGRMVIFVHFGSVYSVFEKSGFYKILHRNFERKQRYNANRPTILVRSIRFTRNNLNQAGERKSGPVNLTGFRDRHLVGTCVRCEDF